MTNGESPTLVLAWHEGYNPEHDPRGMHRLWLRPVSVPGLQQQEIARPSIRVDPLLRGEGTFRNGGQPTADALLTMYSSRQPVATHRNGFGLFLRFLRPRDLPLIATGCNHGAP